MNQTERLDYLISYLAAEAGSKTPLGNPDSFAKKRAAYRSLVNMRPPLPVEPEFLAIQDAFLSVETRERGIVESEALPPVPGDSSLALWQGDICRLQVDAIVNAANNAFLGCFHPCHGCIDNAIHTAAGIQLRQACYE